ncbi:unnamed protein product [Lactuca saligna]|uniref:Uncharacterized protein n=1 Tax=Lactuca saligna TaxID=75948 RepID=A0AA35Y1B0_LACSI|nr:unnamed protein product [Lactuca saligna]
MRLFLFLFHVLSPPLSIFPTPNTPPLLSFGSPIFGVFLCFSPLHRRVEDEVKSVSFSTQTQDHLILYRRELGVAQIRLSVHGKAVGERISAQVPLAEAALINGVAKGYVSNNGISEA